MRTGEIARQIDGVELAAGDASVEVDDVVFDSRKAGPGALFAALRGVQADGHDFVDSALERGASAVLVEPDFDASGIDAAVLTAQRTRQVLGPVSAAVFGQPSRDLQLVGVTGTNGKTTTCWMLEQLLGADGGSVGVIGTVNHRWGEVEIPAVNTTPESAEIQSLLARMRDDAVRRVAMEVSSHGLETHRLLGCAFDVGVFTNLSQDHLDFHGTMEAYFRAKARLFTELLPAAQAAGKTPIAVINADDDAGAKLVDRVTGLDSVRCVTFGRGEGAQFRVSDVESTLERTAFAVDAPVGRLDVSLPLIGDFNVMNATAALAAALSIGMPPNELLDALDTLPQIPGRMERVDGGGPSVFVDYAHTPDALARALEVLRPLCSGELTVVFGAGGDRDRGKRPAMGKAASERADRVFVTSDNPRSEPPASIIDDILSGCGASLAGLGSHDSGDLVAEEDRARAIRSAIATSCVDDIVLIAGKGHETYQEIHGERRPFDDRDVARGALSGEPSESRA
jgi:UDP-N-acetylmuramyl-tripeptide synthetase